MADEDVRAGAARSFEFTPRATHRRAMAPRRWQAFMWYDDKWIKAPAPMPEGACARYVDVDHRAAGAVALEAVPVGVWR